MKNILLIILILCGLVASGQYLRYNTRADFLAISADAFNLPGVSTPALKTAQKPRAGAMVYDSTGGSRGVYVYTGSAWVKMYDTLMSISATFTNPFLGYRYNDSASAVTGDFTNVGASYSVTGGNIVFTSGGNNDGTKYLYSGGATCQEQWIGTIGFKVTSKNSTSYGPYIGIHSINTVGAISTGVQFDMTTGAGSGKASLLLGAAYGVQGSTSALTFSVGDSIEVTIERNVSVLTVNAKNITTGSVATPFIYDYKFTDGVYIHNTGYFALEQRSDSFSVYKLQYFSKAVKNPDWVVAGDSKAMGYFANTFWDSYSGKMKFAFNNTVVLAGPGDMIQDLAKRLQEIIDLHPTKGVLLAMVSNSMRNGEVGYVARYDSCVTVLEAAGVPCYHLEPIPETGGLDQSSFVTHLRSTYPAARIIYVYDEFKENAAGYIYSDNVHPNQAGHDFIFNKILESGKLTGAKTIIKTDIWVKGQDAYDQPVPFRISGTGLIRNSLVVGDSSFAASTNQFRVKLAPDYTLSVYNSGAPDITMLFGNDARTQGRRGDIISSDLHFNPFTTGGAYTTDMMVINNTGVGVGTSPSKKFHTSGTVRHASLGTASVDTTNFKPLVIDLNGDVLPFNHWPVGAGGGGGDVTKVGTPVNNQVGVWTGDGTIEGDADFTFDGAQLNLSGSTTNSSLRLGSLEHQSYSVNNGWFGDNAYFDGAAFKYRANGYATLLYMSNTGLSLQTAPNGSAGASATMSTRLNLINDGSFGIGGSQTAVGNTNGSYIYGQNGEVYVTGGASLTDHGAYKLQVEGDSYFSGTARTSIATIGGTLNSQFTDVGNVGAGEDNLMTYTMPAGALSQNGDFLEIEMGFMLTSANNKTIKVVIGTNEFSFFSSTSTGNVFAKLVVIRKDATTGSAHFFSPSPAYTDVVAVAVTWSGAVTIKATGEATNTDEIKQRTMTVKYFPAN